MNDRAHLRLIPGGAANYVTHGAPREWSQSPENVRMVEALAEKHCPSCAGRGTGAGMFVLGMLAGLIGPGLIWGVLWMVRKGWIE
jgi:hypothetical protein